MSPNQFVIVRKVGGNKLFVEQQGVHELQHQNLDFEMSDAIEVVQEEKFVDLRERGKLLSLNVIMNFAVGAALAEQVKHLLQLFEQLGHEIHVVAVLLDGIPRCPTCLSRVFIDYTF